ncbi:hypothetical protein ACFQV2_05305 [Actinokineospora soli]|uniref:Uncharacterized protein n=1 Tax=Actinokineospora soli TaxID=1048753 RepID=A0ABW2THG5_9PSEU
MSRTTQRETGVSSPSASDDGERYRPGGRRTTAEPLAATWRPEAGRRAPAKRGFLATYGWRVYAIPVLLAVTALVVVRTAGRRPRRAAPTRSTRRSASPR